MIADAVCVNAARRPCGSGPIAFSINIRRTPPRAADAVHGVTAIGPSLVRLGRVDHHGRIGLEGEHLPVGEIQKKRVASLGCVFR
jgi:hypothetical protein